MRHNFVSQNDTNARAGRVSKKKESEKKVGRPTKFNEAISAKIQDLAKKGKTPEEIAEIIGIAPRTLYYWIKNKTEFMHSFIEAKQTADDLVEASLFQRAIGYSHKAVKIMQHEGDVIVHEYTEHYPPDTYAAKFWLENRKPEQWRSRQELEHTGANGEPLPQTQVIVNIPSNGRESKD